MGQQIGQAHPLARGGRGHGQQSLVRRVVLQVVHRGHAAGASGQRGMGSDVPHPLPHQPQAAPVPEALQVLFSPTYGHVLTSRRFRLCWETPHWSLLPAPSIKGGSA
jgi:hypothetical protein